MSFLLKDHTNAFLHARRLPLKYNGFWTVIIHCSSIISSIPVAHRHLYFISNCHERANWAVQKLIQSLIKMGGLTFLDSSSLEGGERNHKVNFKNKWKKTHNPVLMLSNLHSIWISTFFIPLFPLFFFCCCTLISLVCYTSCLEPGSPKFSSQTGVVFEVLHRNCQVAVWTNGSAPAENAWLI